MLVLQTLAPWLLLAFLGQQVSVSSGKRGSGARAAHNNGTAALSRAQRGSSSRPGAFGKGNVSAKGNFSTKGKFSIKEGKFSIKENNMQCSWTPQDVGDTVRVLVRCEDPEARIRGGVTDLRCHYNGKPQLCPQYQSDNKGFWKQVDRAFKRLQAKVCHDDRRQVRAVMCKRAPRDAHFKLDIDSSVASAQSGGYEEEMKKQHPHPPATTRSSSNSTACTKRANHQKTAEEKCSGSWASVCNFFLSMLQRDEDC